MCLISRARSFALALSHLGPFAQMIRYRHQRQPFRSESVTSSCAAVAGVKLQSALNLACGRCKSGCSQGFSFQTVLSFYKTDLSLSSLPNFS